MQNAITHWLDNKAFAGHGGSLPVTNPATGAVTGQVALATVEDAHRDRRGRCGPRTDQFQPLRQRHRDLHQRRRRRPPLPERGRGRHDRHQRADPGALAYYSFGGWKASLFGDSHAHGVDGVQFFTRGKAITSRWLDPSVRSAQSGTSHGGIELGFPQNK